MKKGFSRALLGLALVPALLFASPSRAFAKSEGDVTPYEYVFMTALEACGIRSWNTNGQWLAAYEGYLEASGDTAMLAQLQGYKSLSWGGTAAGMDVLVDSLKGWLSLSPAYGTDARFYVLPSKAAPQPDRAAAYPTYCIRSTPFSDVDAFPGSGHHHIYSIMYTFIDGSGRLQYVHRNVYAPDGIEVFGVTTNFNLFDDYVTVRFYKKDPSSSTGYSLADLRYMQAQYYADGSLAGKWAASYPRNNDGAPVRCVMNLPIKVFSNADDAERYAQTGVASNLFTGVGCSLWWHSEQGAARLQRSDILEVGDTMRLPADNASAMTAYKALANVPDLATASSLLSASGLDVSYRAGYKVEHYQQDPTGDSWTLTDVEELSGTAGEDAAYQGRSYDGFTLEEDRTEGTGKLTSDGSTVIKLYYRRLSPTEIAAASILDVVLPVLEVVMSIIWVLLLLVCLVLLISIVVRFFRRHIGRSI